MKKRIWSKAISILTAILLVVGIVPNTTITALAAGEDAPNNLYVGNERLPLGKDSYWSTNQDPGALTPCTGSGDDWNVKYESSSNTLTLRGASIQGGSNAVSAPYGSGIYALSHSGQPVSLTIKLIGENTITGFYGIFLNAEINASSYGTNATLTITGESNGSLKVSGSNHGIYVQSGTDDASLTIKNASVDAKTTQTNSGYVGVYVCSSTSATNSPLLSLAVNGGSLTASGGTSSDGILFNVGSSQATGATTSLTVSDNAIVRANGGIKASRVDEPTPSGTGIVFDGTEGTVYGDVTLQEDITINQGESLTIRDGASLNTGNNKVTVNGGTLNGEDKITGTVKYTPSITTASLPEGKVNEEYDAFLTADGSEPIEWSVIQEDSLPTGLSLSKDGKITGKPTAPGDYVFTVTASNDVGSVSKELTITVKDVDPIYSIQNSGDISFADAIESYTPEVKTIMITNDGNQPITLNQSVSSESFEVGTLSKTTLSVGETAEFTVQPKTGLLAGSYDEDIKITGTNNGQSTSSIVNVKFNVKHNAVKVERKDPTCTEKGNIEYWYCEACRKYFQDEALTKELKQEETILPATGHNLTKVDEKKPTVDAAGNIEYWYCKVCDKYFSDEKAEHEITLEDTIIAKLPKFVSGANQEWTKGSKDGLTFKIDTDIKEFKKVLVDGKELKDKDYDIKSGSTILTLKPSFLDTLSAGKHKIRFEFNTGSVEAYFTVKDKENSSQTESANTGVQNKYGLWIVLLLVAAGGLAGFGILSKRRKNHK